MTYVDPDTGETKTLEVWSLSKAGIMCAALALRYPEDASLVDACRRTAVNIAFLCLAIEKQENA